MGRLICIILPRRIWSKIELVVAGRSSVTNKTDDEEIG